MIFQKSITIFFLEYKVKSIALLNVHLDILKWKIQNNEVNHTTIIKTNSLKWTRDISDLVLLIYGLAETSSFNNGNVDIKTISNYISGTFGIKIKDYSNIFRQIRKRKIKDRTAFLEEIRIKLLKRMDNTDNGKYIPLN